MKTHWARILESTFIAIKYHLNKLYKRYRLMSQFNINFMSNLSDPNLRWFSTKVKIKGNNNFPCFFDPDGNRCCFSLGKDDKSKRESSISFSRRKYLLSIQILYTFSPLFLFLSEIKEGFLELLLLFWKKKEKIMLVVSTIKRVFIFASLKISPR